MDAISTNEFKSFMKLPGGAETDLCFYPWKLDTYGKGCNGGCLYCYARGTLEFRGLWDAVNPAPADFAKIAKVFSDHFDKGKRTKYSEYLDARLPIRMGGMTDCMMDSDLEHRVTLHTLELLRDYNYPVLILTKNTNVARDEYIEAMDPSNTYVQFSICTPYDEVARVFEPERLA